MKSNLLLGALLLTTIAGSSQSKKLINTGVAPVDIYALKYGLSKNLAVERTTTSPVRNTKQSATSPALEKSSAVTNVSWNLLCGSMNVNGMLVSHSRPLQYHPGLDAVSFIHRKSIHYTTSPVLTSAAQSGVVVAEVSTNWGFTFDSTAIWVDDNQWGRYPQGAIYNPPSNTNLSNAYIVGCGPTVSGSNFTGTFYASKQLNAFNNASTTVSGGQQFYAFSSSSNPSQQPPHGWSRNGFTSTDDGLVRSLGIFESDFQGLITVHAFAVSTGSFNGTSFDWSVDTLSPDCIIDDDGQKHLSPDPQMAFNQSGTIGYIVGLGAINGSTLANRSFQPIIYKMDRTNNSAATWTLMTGIDFNHPSMLPVVKSTFRDQRGLAGLHVVGNDTIGVPFVDDYDITVDKDGYLHIGATLMSAFSDAPESLEFIAQFTTSINPNETYKWRHTPGSRPYLYDFIGDGVGQWKYMVIDSIASEGPGIASTQGGFAENPWDVNDNLKVNIDSRIQLGRSPSGDYITFSWSESDSIFTNSQFKWNNLPNIKVRMMEILNGPFYHVNVGPKQDVTKGHPTVQTRATLHYMSPTSSSAAVTGAINTPHTADVKMPFTVTNSNPYSQTTNNATWYGQANLTFSFAPVISTGAGNRSASSILSAVIFPNPANDRLTIEIVSGENATADIYVTNLMGQRVSSVRQDCHQGKNALTMDVQNLSAGVYFVTVQVNGQKDTQKLVVE